MLAVVGDSFATLDTRHKCWPKFVSEGLNLELHNLARSGADSMYIHAQMKYAVEELNVTHMIVWQTHHERVLIPSNSDVNSPIKANNIINSSVEGGNESHQELYKYPDYNPDYISDNIPSIIDKYQRDLELVGIESSKAYGTWITYLQNEHISSYNKDVYVENMYYYLDYHKIKTVMVDLYKGQIEEYYDLKDSDYVKIIDPSKSGFFDWASDVNHDHSLTTNHFPSSYNKRFGEYILEYFN